MVVAPSATKAQAQEHLAGGIGNVSENDLPLPSHIALVPLVDGVSKISGCDQHIRVLRGNLVTSKLLPHELIVGFVAIQTFDDPIPVTPCSRAVSILVVAVALRVAHQIKPMLRPALAVSRACKQRIHEPLVGVRRRVSRELSRLLRRRRQSV